MGTFSRSNWNLAMLVFEEREDRSTQRKTSRSKDENKQQTQPTYDAESGNRNWTTLVGGRDGALVRALTFLTLQVRFNFVKDGANFCYCAYVLRILRFSGFLWVVPTNTGIFFARFETKRRK